MLPPLVLEAARRSAGGVLTTDDLRRLGYDRRRVAEWVAAGLLERLLRGIYRVAAAPVPPTQCLHVPLRYLSARGVPGPGPAGLITAEAALALVDVPGFELPCRPLVLVDRSRSIRLSEPPFDVLYVPLDRVVADRRQGVDVADMAQTLADLARNTARDDRELRVATDDVRNRTGIDAPHLAARWRTMGPHRGARRLLGMLSAFEQESEGERRLFRCVFERMPPLPDCQVVVLGRRRVDFVFLSAALIVEYLGAVHDTRVDQDAVRNLEFDKIGYHNIAVTKSMLGDPVGLGTHIHDVRRRRERLLLEGLLPRPELPPQPARLVPLRTLAPLG